MMNNKKAQTSGFEFGHKTIFFILFLLVLTAEILFVYFSTLSFKSSVVKVSPEFESAILERRLLNCVAYRDDFSERIYDIIDVSKFNDGIFLGCFLTDNKKLSVRMTLKDSFDKVLVDFNNGGAISDYSALTRTFFVNYIDSGLTKTGSLVIEVWHYE